VDIVTSRGKKSSRGFVTHDRNFDTNTSRAELERNFDLTLGLGGYIRMLTLREIHLKHEDERGIWVQNQCLFQACGKP
jgi:hypothetical protein